MRPSNPQVLYEVLQFIRGMPIAVPDGRPGDFPKHFRDTRTRHPKVASIAQCTMGRHCGSPVVPGPGRTYARAQPFSTPLAPILFQSGIQTFSSITCKSTNLPIHVLLSKLASVTCCMLHWVCLYHAEESERIRRIPMYMYRQDVYLDDIHTFLLVHVGFRAAPQTYSFSRCCTDRWTLFT